LFLVKLKALGYNETTNKWSENKNSSECLDGKQISLEPTNGAKMTKAPFVGL